MHSLEDDGEGSRLGAALDDSYEGTSTGWKDHDSLDLSLASLQYCDSRDRKLMDKIEFVRIVSKYRHYLFGEQNGPEPTPRSKEEGWKMVAKDVEDAGLDSYKGKAWTRLRDHDWQYVRRHALSRNENANKPTGRLGILDSLVLELVTPTSNSSNGLTTTQTSEEQRVEQMLKSFLGATGDAAVNSLLDPSFLLPVNNLKDDAIAKLPISVKCEMLENSLLPLPTSGGSRQHSPPPSNSSSRREASPPGVNVNTVFSQLFPQPNSMFTTTSSSDNHQDHSSALSTSGTSSDSPPRQSCTSNKSSHHLHSLLNRALTPEPSRKRNRSRFVEESTPVPSSEEVLAKKRAELELRKLELEARRMELQNEKLEKEIEMLVAQERRANEIHHLEVQKLQAEIKDGSSKPFKNGMMNGVR